MKYSAIIFLIVLGLTSACTPSNKSEGEDKIIYDVVFREDLAGTYEKWKTADRSFGYYYTYTDRGRGPEYTEEISLNDQNFISSQTIKGVNYLKASIDESFSSTDATAVSKNLMGTTKGDFYGEELYFRYDGSPAVYEILAQLLLKSETGKVKLYPEGEAELTNNIPLQLSDGSSVELLVINGLDLDPTYLWMMNDHMVGKISGNLHIVRKDLSPLRLEMKKVQDNIEDESLIEVAKKLSHDINNVVIKNVNVFTAGGALLPNRDVFVEGQTIKGIH
ncbi:MAG: hypothetical protein RIF39_05695, partial [Cyclobacteriaceae bacterium]